MAQDIPKDGGETPSALLVSTAQPSWTSGNGDTFPGQPLEDCASPCSEEGRGQQSRISLKRQLLSAACPLSFYLSSFQLAQKKGKNNIFQPFIFSNNIVFTSSAVKKHKINIGLCFLNRRVGGLFIFVCKVFFSTSKQSKPWDKGVVVPQGSMQEGQVGVPGASPCAPCSITMSTVLTLAVGIVFFSHAKVLQDHTALLNRRQRRAALHWQLWDAAWLPHFPNPGETPMSQVGPAQPPWLAPPFTQELSSSPCLPFLLFHS